MYEASGDDASDRVTTSWAGPDRNPSTVNAMIAATVSAITTAPATPSGMRRRRGSAPESVRRGGPASTTTRRPTAREERPKTVDTTAQRGAGRRATEFLVWRIAHPSTRHRFPPTIQINGFRQTRY